MATNNIQKSLNSYIEEKVEILADFGLSDRVAVSEYLKCKSANATTVKSGEIKIDSICRTLIQNRLDGDRTFVKKRRN